jgi:nitrite reductase/ring-hydroxylating ferredoxin subunit
MMLDGVLQSATREWRSAGSVADFPLGTLTAREIGGRTVLVASTPRGLFAVGATCPHQGASLVRAELTGTMVASAPGRFEYGCDGDLLRCPWHRWEFHADDGRTAFGTSPKRLVTYPLRVVDGDVQVLVRRD